MYDAQGKQVYVHLLNNSRLSFNFSGSFESLPKGVYDIRLVSPQGTISQQRVVLQ